MLKKLDLEMSLYDCCMDIIGLVRYELYLIKGTLMQI